MIVMDGRKPAEELLKEARAISDGVADATGRRTQLVVIQVGNDPASGIYVARKERACARAHILVKTIKLPENMSTMTLTIIIDSLNVDPTVDGIMVQLPLPAAIRPYTQMILDHIKPSKDVDGLTSTSLGRLANGVRGLRPCTPLGIMRLMEHYGIAVAGKDVTVIGRSTLVGKPLALMLTNADATVTLCHTKSASLDDAVARADIIVSAVGKPDFIRGDKICRAHTLIDVGINRLEDGSIVGDVAHECYDRCAAYTPVPHGVGQMTVACLVMNTLEAREMGE